MTTGGVSEAVVWIAVNGTRRRVLACSPHDTTALALGHAIGEGWVAHAAQLGEFHAITGPGGAHGVELHADAAAFAAYIALDRHRTQHGCGLRHELDCAPGTLHGLWRGAGREAPTSERLSELFRALFAVADTAAPDGGVHAAALSDGETLLHADADVARHCSVDRVIGRAIAGGAPLGDLGLLLSARISGAMALKAVRAGVAWVASRSLATSLALEIAHAAGLPVLQRAVRRERGR